MRIAPGVRYTPVFSPGVYERLYYDVTTDGKVDTRYKYVYDLEVILEDRMVFRGSENELTVLEDGTVLEGTQDGMVIDGITKILKLGDAA
ncbi:hypothetical protein [Shimazuella kribbensis]|uniref:hypothetical protein n=1 Tax=Shimazuella kribbensis TaxID=139808 RepID=UPI0012EBBACA|nr:hypothetical protein [Shimazuella kribbensis]